MKRTFNLFVFVILLVAALGLSIQPARADNSTPPGLPRIIRTEGMPSTQASAPSFAIGQVLISNLSTGTSAAVGISSANNLASSFTTPATGSYTVGSARLNLAEVSVSSNVFLWLYDDNAGAPGSVVATFTPLYISSFTNFNAEFDFVLPTPYILSASTTYWLVMGTDLTGGIFDAVYWGISDTTPPSGIFTYVKDMDYYSGAWNPPFWGGYRKFALYAPGPEVSLNPTSHDFGNQLVGTTGGAITVTLTNTGEADLHIGTLTFTSDWILSNDTCSGATVVPGGTCTFDVAFHPLAPGALTGSISIPSDAATSPDTVDLSGNGLEPLTTALISSAGQDGHITEKNETAEYGGSSSASGGFLQIGDTNADRQVKGLLAFDTSTLPDGAVVTGVRIEMYLMGAAGTNPFLTHGGLNVDIANPSFGTAALAPGDFQAAPTAYDVAVCETALAMGWFGCDLVSNFADINLTGFTQFRLWFDLPDNDDLRPDYLKVASGNSPKASLRPVLIVEYYVP